MVETRRPAHPVLLVDDEAQALRSMEMALRTMGLNNTMAVDDPAGVGAVLDKVDPEVVLLDLVMPGRSGQEVLEELTADHPEVPVIMVTGMDDVETAVRCIRAGAFDYIVKPLDRERLGAALDRALEVRALRRRVGSLSRGLLAGEPKHPEAFAHMVTASPRMRSLFTYLEAVARGPEPVLLLGETGTGKELMARAVHLSSGRQGGFVAVNLAGLDDEMFSDTLFGHAKGAYTGADAPRAGLVEKAAGGTLFLDEIGDLEPGSQVKLLRLLQEREYLPLGSDTPRPASARVVAATNRDPEDAADTFRRDLYYRLRTHQVRIPPLRERPEDLEPLLDHFLAQAADAFSKPVPTYPPQLPGLLKAHHFPGNVRELRSAVFDAVGKHDRGVLSMESFREWMGGPDPEPEPAGSGEAKGCFAHRGRLPTIKEATADLVEEALRRSGGNLRTAAGLLGISHQALSKRLRRGEPR
jgi:DNA-binding NtrC family response regulator